MQTPPRLTAGLLALTLILMATAHPGASEPEDPVPVVQTLTGPKRTVAVSRFIAKSDFDARYGLSDVGGGLASLLTSALVASGQFLVVERATLSDVLAEQQLGTAGLTTAESAPPLQQLIGADYLIMGAVTAFSERQRGLGFGIGFAGVGLSPQFRTGTVGLEIRVIDTASGQIVSSYQVAESVKSKSIGVNVNKKGISLGHNSFAATPLGKAARQAVAAVVDQFARDAAAQPWTGRVVAFDFGEVVLNSGSRAGIQVDDTFQIQRVLEPLTDPVTGRVLGQRSAQIGHMVVTRVEDELAFGSFSSKWDVVPERGDLVTTF